MGISRGYAVSYFLLPPVFSFYREYILFCRGNFSFTVTYFFLPRAFFFCRGNFFFAAREFFFCWELFSFAVTNFFFAASIFLCRELFSFAVTLVGHRKFQLFSRKKKFQRGNQLVQRKKANEEGRKEYFYK